jgi:O-antigen/teichoic acid export membrane protein
MGTTRGKDENRQMFEKIKELISHIVIYGLGNSGVRLVSFFLIPVYTRYLSPADYGILALVGMLDQILFILMNMGQSSALFRTYLAHEQPEGREAVLTTSLWLILTLSFPIGLLALVIAEPVALILTGSASYTSWVMLGIGGVAFKTLLRMPFAVLRARKDSQRYARLAFTRTMIGLMLAIFFVVGLHLGGRGVLLSQLLAELLLGIYLVPATLWGLKLKFSSRDARDLLGYGIYLIPSGLLNFLLHLSDRYFLKHFSSLQAVGVYALGYRFGEILYFATQAFALAWPQFLFGNLKSPEAPALYARVFTYFLAIMGFLWLAVSLLAGELVKIMAHPSFYEAHRVVPWLAGAFLFQALAAVGNVGMPLHRKVKYRPMIIGTAAGLNLGLNFLLVPHYGPMGAAVTSFASLLVQFVLEILVGNRLYAVPYEYSRIGRLVLVGVALYGVGSLMAWSSIWTALMGKICLLLCSPLLLYASGFFEPGEVARLRGAFGRLQRWSGVLVQAGGTDK